MRLKIQTKLFKWQLSLVLALMLPKLASAYDFKVNNIAYNIVSSTSKTVEVAPKTSSSAGSDGSTNYSGNIVINESVYYSGTNYTVIGIGESAFKNSFISSIILPETLQYIKKEAFNTCFDLEELSIPASVTQIGTSCFWVCPNLKTVYSYSTVPPTCSGSNVFSYMQYNDATLYVPYGCISKYQSAYGWQDFPHFQEMAPSINGHEYVDLQLPSGTLWATTNYGATSPYSYGTYVEWSSNDVITNSWGNEWCTPTINDIKELINNCQWTWTTQNGTKGYLVMGNNGNTIFLPAAGIKMGSVMNAGSWCYYWSSTPESSSMTYILLSTASSVWYGSQNTMASLPIRPISRQTPSVILATGISLNKSELNLEVGETETLVATVAPGNVSNGTVNWTSSNTNIATVNQNGLVTAKAAGTATITATTTDGTNLSATCAVNVASETILSTGITLNKNEMSLEVGETETLVATVSPSNVTNSNVTWSSNNSSVAAVDSYGKVTANSAGTATITAATIDRSEYEILDYIITPERLSINTGVLVDNSVIMDMTCQLNNKRDDSPRFFSSNDTNTDYPGWYEPGTWGLQFEDNGSTLSIKPLGYDDVVRTTCVYNDLATRKLRYNLTAAGILNVYDANDNVYYTYDVTSCTDQTATSSTPIKLFHRYAAHEYFNNHSYVYDIKIWKSNFLIRHYIPVKRLSDNVYGFYDEVNNTFHQNEVNGYLFTGQAKTTPEYIDNGANLTASCIVNVVDKELGTISLNKSSMTLGVGSTDLLMATVLPNDVENNTVNWSSSNNNVATVDANGKVTAVAVGSAAITATTTDGSNLSASCEYTVKAASEMPYSFMEEGIAYNINTGTQTLVITYTDKTDTYANNYLGLITANIPATVAHEGVNYVVIGIAEHAFRNCKTLTSVSLPTTLASVNTYAFGGCEALESMTVASGNPIYDSRNNCNAIIEKATNRLIAGCKTTVIPKNVTAIGTFAFYEHNGLETIKIPSSVTIIERSAFNHILGLKHIVVPNSVLTLEPYVFSMCYGLEEVTIGSGVTSIGMGLIYGGEAVTSLTSYIQDPTIVTMGPNVFANMDYENCVLYVPAGTKSLYQATDQWKDFLNIVEMSYGVSGDVNGDGNVTAADITALYDYLLNYDDTNIVNGDQNGDGNITAADVTKVYDVLLGAQ